MYIFAVALLGLPLTWATAPRLLITNTNGNNIDAFDQDTGAFLGEFASGNGLESPDDMIIGPDGNLYVSSGKTTATSAVLRFDPDTGDFIDVFASGNGMERPYGIAFGPDGNLYVSSFLSDEILRFDGTGAFVDIFATGNAGNDGPTGLNGPNGLVIGPNDDKLYVTTQGSVGGNFDNGFPSQVLRYDIVTGVPEVFIEQPTPSTEGFGFVSLLGIVFSQKCDKNNPNHPECDILISDFANDIRRYDVSGNLEATISTNYGGETPSTNFVGSLAFSSDDNNLFSVGFNNSGNGEPGAILRYKWKTNEAFPAVGESGPTFVPETTELERPIGIIALPE